MSKVANSIEAFEAFKVAVNEDFKAVGLDIQQHNDNNYEIDKLNQSNDDILVSLNGAFSDKLNEFKEANAGVTKREAVNNTFMVLEMSFGVNDDAMHEKTQKVFKQFKGYYTSKLYIPKSKLDYKAIMTANKLLKTVPYKAINEAYFRHEEDVEALKKFVTQARDITTALKELSEAERKVVTDLLHGYIVVDGAKIVTDKSHFQECYDDREVLLKISKGILKAKLSGSTFKGV